jgi:hypothetical protein
MCLIINACITKLSRWQNVSWDCHFHLLSLQTLQQVLREGSVSWVTLDNSRRPWLFMSAWKALILLEETTQLSWIIPSTLVMLYSFLIKENMTSKASHPVDVKGITQFTSEDKWMPSNNWVKIRWTLNQRKGRTRILDSFQMIIRFISFSLSCHSKWKSCFCETYACLLSRISTKSSFGVQYSNFFSIDT